jgi:hypothetical protein
MPPQSTPDRVRLKGPDGKFYTIPQMQVGPFLAKHTDYDLAPMEEAGTEGKGRGFLSKYWEDIKNIRPAGFSPYPGMDTETKSAAAEASHERDVSRQKAGYSLPYRLAAPAAESVGMNVSGAEESARQGDVGGVLGHAAVPLSFVAASEGLRAGTKAYPKVVERLANMRTEAATQGIKQTASAHVGPEFGERLTRTIQRGHLPEIERQYHPKTVRAAANATLEYANKLQSDVIGPAIKRHPTETISGDAVAKAVQDVFTPEMQKFYPEALNKIGREVGRYAGKPITLPEAHYLLEKLNAINRSLAKAAPESAAAAQRIDAAKKANMVAADAIREQLYPKLEQLGEPGIADLQKDYGALRTVGEALRSNIARAERIGTGPSLAKSAFQRHPWLTLVSLGGGYGLHTPAFAAIPVMEWMMERRATPNATIGRSFGKLRGGAEPMQFAGAGGEAAGPPQVEMDPRRGPGGGSGEADPRDIGRGSPVTPAENARMAVDRIKSLRMQVERERAAGDPSVYNTVSKLRQAEVELSKLRTSDVADPARDTSILSRVIAEHPEWTLSKQLQEAAKRAKETGQ